MSFSFGFYNALNHDRLYDAIQVSEIFDGLIRDGVYSTIGDHYVVKASENENEVIVGSGRAWFDHTWNKNDADLPITAPLPDLLMKRYDALVIDINANVASRTNQITWVEGTPSLNTPVKPTLTNTTDHHQYPLCYILRTANNNTIIQDDIENTIGTDECPFVTGILQQVSISDLLLQWTSQFATFMNNNEATASAWEAEWEASMNTWTVEQKNEFATWMAGEKTEFDDWFANLHYILDGDVAGHLQNEIDAIEEGLGGSVFTIHTINSSLYGKTVTCTGSTQEKTAVFDASGNAEIKGITDVGTITFTATDGSQTATTQISVPYFSNYPITMAFWAATVNLSTTSEDLKGKTITIRKGGAVVASTSFNAAGTATYVATSAGTYTFTCQGYSVEQAITEETTYNVTINSGLDLSAWITAGSTTDYPLSPSSYANFAALEADEEAIRQLMLVHNAVDYLATAGTNDTLIEDVINSDICAKWINLSDYALDTLSANANIKSVMDEADKYGYGEYGLVGQVPTMTSNTAPSGIAFQSTTHQLDAYKAFDGDDSTYSHTNYNVSVGTEAFLGYIFTESKVIKRVHFKCHLDANYYSGVKDGKLQASNDTTNGTDGTWVDLTGRIMDTNPRTKADWYYDIDNNTPYKAYRINSTDSYYGSPVSNTIVCTTLQFYAYEPLGNVPIMTANNAPYGTAISDANYAEAYQPYFVFMTNPQYGWLGPTTNEGTHYIGYKFVNPVCVRKVKIGTKLIGYSGNAVDSTVKLRYSNDGSTWTELDDSISIPAYTDTVADVENDVYALYWAIRFVSWNRTNPYNMNVCSSLQFYGRELKPLVPTMTSNTTPKGVCSASAYESTYYPYKAFDTPIMATANSQIAGWSPTSSSSYGSTWVQYEAEESMKPKMVSAIAISDSANNYNNNYKLQCGNTESDLTDALTNILTPYARTVYTYPIPNDVDAKIFRFVFVSSSKSSINGGNGQHFQVWGYDYSEKEFASGSTRKTIYDHGLELVTFDEYLDSGSITYEPNQIYVENTATNHSTKITALIDYGTNEYSMQGMIVGNKMVSAYNANAVYNTAMSSTIASSLLVDKYNTLDVSSISGQNRATGVTYYGGAGTFSIAEWWLE